MNYSELVSRPVADLRLLAAQYGIKTHHKAKAETIAKLIVEHISKPKAEMLHPAEVKSQEPPPVHTEEAVRAKLKTLAEKQGFTMEFPGDDTVIFKYRGAEESVHLSTIMRVIVNKAQNVSMGARNPRAIKGDQTNPTVNSGTIMMV